jgi:type I restriction enzyme, S subunit
MSSDCGATLRDYFTLQRGNTYKSRLLGELGPVLLGLASIHRNGGFRDDNLRTYGGHSDERLLVDAGDLYVSLKDVTQAADLLGAVARFPEGHGTGRLTQDTVKLVPRGSGLPLDYLYWIMRTPHYRGYCRSHATGTTNLGLPRDDFLDYPVPSLTGARERIVRLLEALEGKIDLNQRIGSTLEASAQAMFRARYIDFTVPAEFTEGRNLIPLGEVARHRRETVKPGELAADLPYIGLEHMPRGSVNLHTWGRAEAVTSAKARFDAGDILFGRLRPYFKKVGIAHTRGVCSTDIAVVQPQQSYWRAFLLFHLASQECIDYATAVSSGTRMPRAKWQDLARYEVVLPTEADARRFEAFAEPLLSGLAALAAENRTLAELRDTLLPKLISGELRVGDAERVTEDVA